MRDVCTHPSECLSQLQTDEHIGRHGDVTPLHLPTDVCVVGPELAVILGRGLHEGASLDVLLLTQPQTNAVEQVHLDEEAELPVAVIGGLQDSQGKGRHPA